MNAVLRMPRRCVMMMLMLLLLGGREDVRMAG